MYHYVYLLQHYRDLRFYIGVRSCNKLPTEDTKYLGSSKTVSRGYKQECTKYILASFPTRKEAVAYEIYLHDKYDVAQNKLFFNAAKQTSTGFDTTGITSPRKNCKLSEITKHKLRIANLGKKQSEETIKKRSEKLKGRPCSEETRRKIGLKNKANLTGRKKPLAERQTNQVNFLKYLFIHDNGEEFYSTLWEFRVKFNFNRPTHLYRMAKGLGNARSYKGWRITQLIKDKPNDNK